MSATQAWTLILILAGLVGVVSAAAGALWWRARAVPLVRAVRLAHELAERQRVLEDLILRLDAALKRVRQGPRSAVLSGPLGVHRIDPAQTSAVAGPTLIAVPDLAAPAGEAPSAAAAELAGRFGAIWELADAGSPADAIARSTGHPIGQVELILGLRRQLAAAEGRA
jgi:hypothetical protein